jgi:hypothetical protein
MHQQGHHQQQQRPPASEALQDSPPGLEHHPRSQPGNLRPQQSAVLPSPASLRYGRASSALDGLSLSPPRPGRPDTGTRRHLADPPEPGEHSLVASIASSHTLTSTRLHPASRHSAVGSLRRESVSAASSQGAKDNQQRPRPPPEALNSTFNSTIPEFIETQGTVGGDLGASIAASDEPPFSSLSTLRSPMMSTATQHHHRAGAAERQSPQLEHAYRADASSFTVTDGAAALSLPATEGDRSTHEAAGKIQRWYRRQASVAREKAEAENRGRVREMLAQRKTTLLAERQQAAVAASSQPKRSARSQTPGRSEKPPDQVALDQPPLAAVLPSGSSSRSHPLPSAGAPAVGRSREDRATSSEPFAVSSARQPETGRDPAQSQGDQRTHHPDALSSDRLERMKRAADRRKQVDKDREGHDGRAESRDGKEAPVEKVSASMSPKRTFVDEKQPHVATSSSSSAGALAAAVAGDSARPTSALPRASPPAPLHEPSIISKPEDKAVGGMDEREATALPPSSKKLGDLLSFLDAVEKEVVPQPHLVSRLHTQHDEKHSRRATVVEEAPMEENGTRQEVKF